MQDDTVAQDSVLAKLVHPGVWVSDTGSHWNRTSMHVHLGSAVKHKTEPRAGCGILDDEAHVLIYEGADMYGGTDLDSVVGQTAQTFK